MGGRGVFREFIEFMCIFRMRSYVWSLIFGFIFFSVGLLMGLFEVATVMKGEIESFYASSFLAPVLFISKLFFEILVILSLFFVWVLTSYTFFWFGLNLGNLVGWIWRKIRPEKGEKA